MIGFDDRVQIWESQRAPSTFVSLSLWLSRCVSLWDGVSTRVVSFFFLFFSCLAFSHRSVEPAPDLGVWVTANRVACQRATGKSSSAPGQWTALHCRAQTREGCRNSASCQRDRPSVEIFFCLWFERDGERQSGMRWKETVGVSERDGSEQRAFPHCVNCLRPYQFVLLHD